MGRYHMKVQSGTAVPVDTAFAWLMCVAGNGFNLKRVDCSLITVGSASAPPDQQCTLGIAPVSTAGTTITAATASGKLNANYPPFLCLPAQAWVTPPTIGVGTTDPYQISCSSRGGGILNWEQPDEWQVPFGVTNGLAFVNRVNALTTPLAWVISVEWEE